MTNQMPTADSTQQEIFDYVYKAVVEQGKPSTDLDGGCAYRGLNGLKCAAGHLIKDKEYDPRVEGKSVMSKYSKHLPSRIKSHDSLVRRLQRAHDFSAVNSNKNDAFEFITKFKKLASAAAVDFGLTVPQEN